MCEIDEQYLVTPWYGSRQMARHLRRLGHDVGRKRVRRLMRLMGLRAVAPQPGTSRPAPHHKVYPYLLRDVAVERANQAWCADVTYVPMGAGLLAWRRLGAGWCGKNFDLRRSLEMWRDSL